jgi:hypothetical protein
LAGVYLLVLALRWVLVSGFCSQVPFWDEWLDSAPYLRDLATGTFDPGKYLAMHNVHRMVLPRLATAAAFLLNDRQWDSQAQSTVNAFLGAAIPVMLLALLGAARDARRLDPAVLAGVGLLFGLPLLWYNTAWAFQIAWYSHLGCSLAGLGLVLGSRAFRPGWWVGWFFLVLALLNIRTGITAPAALLLGTLLLAGRRGLGQNWRQPEFLVTAVLALALILGALTDMALAPKVRNPMVARNAADLAVSLLRNLNWLWEIDGRPGDSVWIGLVLSLPAPVLLLAWFFRARWLPEERFPEERARVLLVLALWCLAQLAASALGRGAGGAGPSWRHYDLHAIWTLVNIAAAAILFRTGPRGSVGLALAAAGFVAVAVAGATRQCLVASALMKDRQAKNITQREILTEYLYTGNKALFQGRRHFETPFSFLDDPGALLDDPVIRGMLPTSLRAELPLGPQHDLRAPRAFIQAPMPPFEATPRFTNLWVSWRPFMEQEGANFRDLGQGNWTLPPTRFPYLEFRYFGDFRGQTDPLILSAPASGASGATWLADLGEVGTGAWLTATMRAESRPRLLKAQETSPRTWMAVSEPVEAGRLTVWARAWRQRFDLLVLAGAALLASGWFLARKSPAPSEDGDRAVS